MPKPLRLAWDSSCFTAFLERKETEDVAALQALDTTFVMMTRGEVRIMASRAIEVEVRPGSVELTRQFHQQLKACPSFESFGESPAVRRLASNLQERLQASGRRGQYADLIHVATAISGRASEFWTLDKKLVNWHAQGILTEVKICRPYLEQGKLPFD